MSGRVRLLRWRSCSEVEECAITGESWILGCEIGVRACGPQERATLGFVSVRHNSANE